MFDSDDHHFMITTYNFPSAWLIGQYKGEYYLPEQNNFSITQLFPFPVVRTASQPNAQSVTKCWMNSGSFKHAQAVLELKKRAMLRMNIINQTG